MKYLEINLTKHVQDFYIKTLHSIYKTFLTETKADLNKWTGVCSWTGSFSIVKVAIMLILIYIDLLQL